MVSCGLPLADIGCAEGFTFDRINLYRCEICSHKTSSQESLLGVPRPVPLTGRVQSCQQDQRGPRPIARRHSAPRTHGPRPRGVALRMQGNKSILDDPLDEDETDEAPSADLAAEAYLETTLVGRLKNTLEPPAQSADIVLSLFSFFLSSLSPLCVLSSSLPPSAPILPIPPSLSLPTLPLSYVCMHVHMYVCNVCMYVCM